MEQRRRALEEARIDLAHRMEERSLAQEAVMAADSRLRQARAHLWDRRSSSSALAGAVQVQDINLERAYLERLAAVVRERQEARDAAATRLEQADSAEREARDAALVARRELEVLERDRERFRERERRARARRETEAADELAAARHPRTPRRGRRDDAGS